MYNKKEIFEKSVKLTKSKNLFFIEDIIALIGISKPTFYEFFPPESNELNELKKLIEENRVKVKQVIRKKWFDSDNPTSQFALYKLIGTEEERKRLSTNYNELTGKDGGAIEMEISPLEKIRKSLNLDNVKAD